MQAGTKVEAEFGDVGDDCLRTADGPRRAIEGREEAIAGGVELLSAETGELASHDRVVLREQVAPLPVAEFGRALGGTDDVSEENGREDAVGDERVLLAAQEALDLGRYLVSDPSPTVAGDLHGLRAWD